MSWFKLDDQGHDHPKVLEAGNEAYGAWCRAGQWSSNHLTDGAIPRAAALKIARKKVWEILQRVGLVDATDHGWIIHDFLDYNPPSGQVRAERARKAKNLSNYRARKRSEPGSRGAHVTGGETGDEIDFKPGTQPGVKSQRNHGPDPDPDPVASQPSPLSPPTGGASPAAVRVKPVFRRVL